MTNKRYPSEVRTDETYAHPTKRLRLSPIRDRDRESSSCSVSEATAVQSSPRSASSTEQSSIVPPSLLDTDGSENEITSSDSSSDSESDEVGSDSSVLDDGESDGDIVTVRGTSKPHISSSGVLGQARDLKSRLATFLPQLKQANSELDGSTNLEDVDEEEQHIEMNLGLGVLEARNGVSSDDDEEDSSDEEHVDQSLDSDPPEEKPIRQRDIMQRLLGQSKVQQKAGIEVVHD